MEHSHRGHVHGPNCRHPVKVEGTVKDPVCGMNIDSKTAKGGSSVFNGETYFFCNPKCKTKFDADPESYIKPKPVAAPSPDAQREIYTWGFG